MAKSVQVGVNFIKLLSNYMDDETNSYWKLQDPHGIDASFIIQVCFDIMKTLQNNLWTSQQIPWPQ